MDALTEAKTFINEAIRRLHMLQHHGPSSAQPLLAAVLMNLEGCVLSLDDVSHLVDRSITGSGADHG